MRLYRALLRLYPRSFRDEYGGEMAAVFAARRRAASGPLARLALWPSAFLEVVTNAAAVHLDLTRQDVKHTLRAFGRARGFAFTAVLVIGLGIGATSASFSITEFVLFRPLPFPEPDRLVRLWETTPGYNRMELSPANARDWRARQSSLETMGLFTFWASNLTGAGEPVRIEGALADAALFEALGVAPITGRALTAADAVPNAPAVALISHSLWRTQFGMTPDIVGRTIRLDDNPVEVVGVMPESFVFPSPETRFWASLQLPEGAYQDRNDNWLYGVGRLAPGVDLDRALADFGRIAADLAREIPQSNENSSALVIPLRDDYSRASRTLVLALAGASACLLVITLVNLVNLLLARLLSRRRELVVRAVLGAGRERLARQQLTESMMLAAAGGLLGVMIAAGAVPLFARLVPASLPMAAAPAVDWRVWLYAAGATVATGLVTGVLPVLLGRRADFSALGDGERAGGGARERTRAVLVAVSVVASVVLLVGSGLFLRAMWKLQNVDPGFEAERVLAVRTVLPMPKYGEAEPRARWYREVIEETRAIAGVTGAAYISFLPMEMRGGIWPVVIDGDEVGRSRGQVASLRFVTPGFFDVMGIPVRAGRDVAYADTADQPRVAVVSESFVERYWPGETGLGRRFTFAFDEREIVGVVGDIRVRGLEQTSEPQVYLPAAQVGDNSLVYYAPKELVIRTAGASEGVLPAVREIVRRADPDLPVASAQWLSDVVAGETASRAVQLRVLGAFAAVALLLAGVGIHGLLAFVVSERRREIGVRMALGARSSEILAMVLQRAAAVAGGGLAIGLVVAYWAGRGLEAALAGVPRTDPATLTGTALLIALVAAVGSLLPARRAASIDPARAMRNE